MALLTKNQHLGLEIATRTSSIVSLLGSLFIVVTFICFSGFRTSKTRLLFYATWANIITNIATLVSASALPIGLENPSPLCEMQAFLIQCFMLADPFWVFCMAFNVWYIFQYRCLDEKKLLDLERWYILFAYGVPAIVPIAYLVHDHVSGYRIVGSAILWCWIREEYDWMRIAFFYAPMWILAVATMSIHIWVGVQIYKTKVEVRRVTAESRKALAPSGVGTLEDPFSYPRNSIAVMTTISHRSRTATPESSQTLLTPSSSPQKATTNQIADAFSITGSSARSSPTKYPSRLQPLSPLNPNSPHRPRPLAIGRYRATAYAAPLASGEFATLPSPHVPIFRPAEHAAHVQRRKETADMFSYFKVALLLFVALVVVWVPSGINRLYQICYPDHPLYGLNLASAIVLPTQGLWNAVIYAQATWSECKDESAKVALMLKGSISSRQPSVATLRDEAGKETTSVESKAADLASRNVTKPGDAVLMV